MCNTYIVEIIDFLRLRMKELCISDLTYVIHILSNRIFYI